MTTHEFFMERALQLAKNGLGTTYPNPLVGSVIVHDGKIIGEGWHKKAGEPHAEVNAVHSVKDKSLLKEATIYVTLEPCSHFGKTPPCCDLIIAHEIPNVVVGTIDPFAKVAGTGIQKLKASGKNVLVGVLEKECRELNKRFFTFHEKKRPFIILKWAESADGFLAPLFKNKNRPVWITNQYSRQLVHKWRTEEQAILVGTQTVLDDNPKLDARDYYGKNPIRIAIDKTNKIPENFEIKNGKQSTIIFSEANFLTESKKYSHKKAIFDIQFLDFLVKSLYVENIQSIIIEGGKFTLEAFISAEIWDEARIFIGKNNLNSGLSAPVLNKKTFKKEFIFDDQLNYIKNYD
ncbi:bifunctional diaminohydroxyphosphoribosylaminopyrimidine deaminase/5-amino-6-(5-phosphoribosylamino)uracil reductase RibD [Flavobacterium sp.]|uniref:bifunctional diaminohydroxyphosphoribosylaminopyrimidine deaminase/5-amino-6-(5-phosphoribosylamino)uracil reductase RibD n=1 Tax=Flavobacterium sp. TaxID=239 RepID=UPI0035290375